MDLGALNRFVFLTLPNYSMIACANAVEGFRMANRLAGAPVYGWQVVTADGAPAIASNGLTLQPTTAMATMSPPDLLLVCGGVEVREAVDRRVIVGLRRAARKGAMLGGLCTGAFALAEAGLLRGRRCAIHWEDLSTIEEEFPDTEFTGDLYAIDRDRVTCTGGVAPLSLVLAMVEARLGPSLAGAVAAQFLVERVRPGTDAQRAPSWPAGRLGQAVRLMEGALSAPLPAAEVARRVGVSARHLERLFADQLGVTPAAYSTGLRLDRARLLLRESAMPVTEIASACGYATHSRFSAAYRGRFGHTPSDERRTARAAPGRRTPHERHPQPD